MRHRVLGDDGAWLVASKRRASSYLLSVFGSSRLHQYNGLSHQLIPQVAREQPGLSCDVISIDGDHSYEGVAKDIAAVANSTLWNQDSIVLFDDVLWGVAKAINNSIARKILTIKERFGGDYHLDETFSSQAATPYYDGVPSSEYPRTWHKLWICRDCFRVLTRGSETPKLQAKRALRERSWVLSSYQLDCLHVQF